MRKGAWARSAKINSTCVESSSLRTNVNPKVFGIRIEVQERLNVISVAFLPLPPRQGGDGRENIPWVGCAARSSYHGREGTVVKQPRVGCSAGSPRSGRAPPARGRTGLPSLVEEYEGRPIVVCVYIYIYTAIY